MSRQEYGNGGYLVIDLWMLRCRQEHELPITDIAFACGSGGTAAGIGLGSYLYAKDHPNAALKFDEKIPGRACCFVKTSQQLTFVLTFGLFALISARAVPADHQRSGNRLRSQHEERARVHLQREPEDGSANGPGVLRQGTVPPHSRAERDTGGTNEYVSVIWFQRLTAAFLQKFVGKSILFVHTGGQFGMYDKVDALQEVIRQDQVSRFVMD
ncbi:unnamed protein product [Phytophthora lilii]|uniref:Unnamed protein product n=1 Tax=Phytophthora lilii TaxID=2077276 RepID=A0A9W6WWP2_9STRA|nr:unnamed protein product [Phytophthora lilii]